MTDVITVNRGSRMATLLRWSTKNIISRSQSQWIKTTPKNLLENRTYIPNYSMGTYSSFVSDLLYRWPKVRSISWPLHYKLMRKDQAHLLNLGFFYFDELRSGQFIDRLQDNLPNCSLPNAHSPNVNLSNAFCRRVFLPTCQKGEQLKVEMQFADMPFCRRAKSRNVNSPKC